MRDKSNAVPGKAHANAPSLRPPTMMIDLLFGALMLFAMQMGMQSDATVQTRKIDLPKASDNGPTAKDKLLAVVPVKSAAGWLYQTSDGGQHGVDEIVRRARNQRRTIILLIDKNTKLQSYLNAEKPFRAKGVIAALAVIEKGDK
tara:strand:+ start:4281 stop:4715 length:435 start_codon:yes stop_codon:yes gene_type:complete